MSNRIPFDLQKWIQNPTNWILYANGNPAHIGPTLSLNATLRYPERWEMEPKPIKQKVWLYLYKGHSGQISSVSGTNFNALEDSYKINPSKCSTLVCYEIEITK